MKRKLTFLGYSFLFVFLLLANINRNSLSFNNSPQEKKEIINILSTYNTNLKNYIPLVISEVKGEITKLDRDNNSNNLLENIEALENNIKKYQKMCDDNKKELWPMIKTHKSKKLMEMQNEGI